MKPPEHAGEDVLTSREAGGKVIRGSAMRIAANLGGLVLGLVTATLLLRHLGVDDAGRYVTVISLVGIAITIVDYGLNVSASSDLAILPPDERRPLLANIVAQRMAVAAIALVVVVGFALVAGYPDEMVVGTGLAGAGVFLVAVANAYLLPLTVELRNAGVAMVEFLRQVAALAGVAVLVISGARLTPFFAVQIFVGILVLATVPLLVGWGGMVQPRLEWPRQRALLRTALPVAAALVLGQIYFRLVIVLMSLISSAEQTGYFGGSLRAMEALIVLPVLVAGVALPVMTAAARDDLPRLRYAIEGLSEGAVIAGVLAVIVAVRAAEPVMRAIGGPEFAAAGAVLRIQVVALIFIAMYQIWTVGLIALRSQHELILANSLGLLGVTIFALVLVPGLGARGGAIASVLGDALLASLIYWRLHRSTGRVTVRLGFLARVGVAALAGAAVLLLPISDLVASVLAGVVFLVVGYLIGMVPEELRDALGPDGLLRRRQQGAPPV